MGIGETDESFHGNTARPQGPDTSHPRADRYDEEQRKLARPRRPACGLVGGRCEASFFCACRFGCAGEVQKGAVEEKAARTEV